MAAAGLPLIIPAAEALWGAIVAIGSATAAAAGLIAISRTVDEKFPAQKASSVAACPQQPTAALAQAPADDKHTRSERSGNASDVREAPEAEDLLGKSPEEIDEMMKEKGWPSEPTRDGPEGGMRYPNPGKNGEQVRVMPGKSTDPNPVKQGPYGRISKDGKVSDPIPLKGNSTLK